MKEVRLFIAAVILFNEKVAASVGLNGTDLQFIHLLELKVASTPGDLARWSGLTTGGVTVVLDRLEKRGFIRRLPNPSDRRSVIVEPVASKLRKFQPVYQSKGDQLFNALSQSSDRELRIILDFFQRTTRAGETPGREPKSI
ncbi:MAG TPA: MarR family winged helix-turn-helix transcriptional regulator [Bryobacteraceae bacterium]